MYEIPKIQVPVVLNLINDESIAGKMFVTEDLVSAAGNPEIEEFLNADPDHFFSFESDRGAYRLINKAHVLSIETQQTDDEIKEKTVLAPKTMVIHFRNGFTLYGHAYPILAEESRVSDIMNQDGNFLAIYREGKKFVINRAQIVYLNAN